MFDQSIDPIRSYTDYVCQQLERVPPQWEKREVRSNSEQEQPDPFTIADVEQRIDRARG
jgi:hypothetical protein